MKIVIIGVGNELKGDDKVGLEVVEKLKNKIKNENFLFIKTLTPENWIWKIIKLKPKLIVILDSCDFGGKPGEFRIIKENEIQEFLISTHNLPLTLFLRGIKQEISPKIIFIGIQPKEFGFGKEMSKEVKESVKKVVDFVERLTKNF